MDPSIQVDRHWWECLPRENFTGHAMQSIPKAISKPVRDELRYLEEFWAMNEQRSVGMKRTMVYR